MRRRRRSETRKSTTRTIAIRRSGPRTARAAVGRHGKRQRRRSKMRENTKKTVAAGPHGMRKGRKEAGPSGKKKTGRRSTKKIIAAGPNGTRKGRTGAGPSVKTRRSRQPGVAGMNGPSGAVNRTVVRAPTACNWLAVKKLNLSYYVGETLLVIICTHYGYLIQVPYSNPGKSMVWAQRADLSLFCPPLGTAGGEGW